jgi:hemoglobin-like flavoprotein
MPHPVVHSLDLAAARCQDLTPQVYERLFRERPELAALFRKDPALVQGEMLARALEGVLDLVTDDCYARNLFVAEASNHAGYEVSPDIFLTFFRAIADSVRDLLGAEWTPDMAAAWERLRAELDACVLTVDA